MTGDHQVMIGNAMLGKGFPVLIQTMYDSALPKEAKSNKASVLIFEIFTTILYFYFIIQR